MSETQKFAELDKLAEGLKGLGTLSDEEFKKTPQHRKWDHTRKKLPEKEAKEYREYAFQKTQKNKKEQRQNLQELCKHNHPHAQEWLQNQLAEDGKATEQAPSLSSFRDS